MVIQSSEIIIITRMHPTQFRQRLAQGLNDARAVVRRRPSSLTAQERMFRTNMILHVTNGAFGGFGDALTSVPLVMTALLSQLTGSNILIALLGPLRDAGWYLPQFFMAPWVDRARLKVSAYRTTTVFRTASWAALVASIFLLRDPGLLLLSIFLCTVAISLLAGFAALPFLVATAKVIPPNHMGLVFGLRQFTGGLLGIAAGGAVTLILGGQTGLAFPQNYAVVLGCGAFGYALSYVTFGFVKEEPDPAPPKSAPVLANLQRAWAIARVDAQYLRYILMRVALLVGAACVPFLTVYAKRALGVSDAFIGTLISVTLASSLLSNVGWARLSDQRSNRQVMIIAAIMGMGFCAIAAAMTALPSSAVNADLAHGLLMVLFAVSGAMLAGINLVSAPLMIEVAAPDHRSLYIGLSNSILGVVLLLTTLVGVIVDQVGFIGLFVFCGIAFLIGLERLAGMREPRAANGV
jgi:Major Facilitator Superfamily